MPRAELNQATLLQMPKAVTIRVSISGELLLILRLMIANYYTMKLQLERLLRLQNQTHFYLDKWGDTPSKLKKKYGVFDNFKKTWTKKVSGANENGIRIFGKNKITVLKKGLKNGTVVNVMYVKGNYAKVEYKGTVGYCKAKYLK